jgi:DNA-binding transcriptional LysR family regulator
MLHDLRPLAVFAKAVEAGSFRAAAAALGLSPSVVSHHVGALEARLGEALLYRSTRRLALTRAGERLIGPARAMVAAAEDGLDALAGRARQPVGRLRVTAPAVLADSDTVDDLAAFARAHSGVALDLAFADTRANLVAGGIDLALRMGRMTDSGFRTVTLESVPRVLVAAPSYIAARPPARHPGDLAAWDWLHLSPVPRAALFRPARPRAGDKPLRVEFRSRLAADSATALARLAEAGLGATECPHFLVAEALARKRLAIVLPGWTLGALAIHAVWHANAPRAGLVRRLVDFLAARAAARRAGG